MSAGYPGRHGGDSILSIGSSKSSKDTLTSEKYDDIKYVIQEEPTTVVLTVDASPHNENCLIFYTRYIHKIGNKVHVLYISEQFDSHHSAASAALAAASASGAASPTANSEQTPTTAEKGEIEAANAARTSTTNETEREKKSKSCGACCPFIMDAPKLVVKVGASPGVIAELQREDRLKCHQFKRKVKQYFRTNGVLFEFHRVFSNDAAKAILHFTKDMQGTMIVMGVKRKSTFHDSIMGSVSQKVLRRADVPVLIVTTDPEVTTRSQTTIH